MKISGAKSLASICPMKSSLLFRFTGNLLSSSKIRPNQTNVRLLGQLNGVDLHILYMKSSEKTLSRNFNAQELELFCHNRFYGPLVVAYNLNKPPYFLMNFGL